MKQIEVQIMGQGYVLGCPEGGETRLGHAVNKVDEAMCKIRDAGKIKARDRIAVLAALNLAFDLTDRPTSVANEGDSNASTSQMQTLLRRLDNVLAKDNRLL
jgi:cell division protein ZapA